MTCVIDVVKRQSACCVFIAQPHQKYLQTLQHIQSAVHTSLKVRKEHWRIDIQQKHARRRCASPHESAHTPAPNASAHWTAQVRHAMSHRTRNEPSHCRDCQVCPAMPRRMAHAMSPAMLYVPMQACHAQHMKRRVAERAFLHTVKGIRSQSRAWKQPNAASYPAS